MTTVSISNKTTTAKRPPYLLIATAIVAVVLVIAGLSLWFSPIGARYWANPAGAPPALGVTDVEIHADAAQNHVYSPAVVQVPAGSTITWHFNEVDEEGLPVAHNVIFEGFGSEVLETGTYEYTFQEPGVYAYQCTLHPFMEGQVIVSAE